jgi:ribA/ribD-fused uncharacterized protein
VAGVEYRGVSDAIRSFEAEPHRFLSNFWPAKIVLDGEAYPTVEHAYQAAKSFDPESRELIRGLLKPAWAKRAGRRLKARSDWDVAKVDVMRTLLEQKFAPGSDLAANLDHTGDALLEEGNYWGDVFWGVCDGVGKNTLGLLLMEIRAKNRAAA